MRNAIRNLPSLLVPLVLLLAPPAARAQTTTTPTTTTTTPTNGSLGLSKADFADLAFRYKDGDKWYFMNKTTFDTFFNRQRCECNEPVQVRVTLLGPSRAKLNGLMGTVKLRAGDETCVCQGAACNGSLCRDLSPAQDMVGLANGNLDFTFGVRDLFAAGRAESTDPATICDRDDNQNVYLWIDGPDSDTTSDITDTTSQVKLDGIGPPAPTGINAVGGEEALQVSWKTIGQLSDFQGYQVLCARGGEYPVFANPPRARYSAATTCSTTTADGGTTDATADGGAADASSADYNPIVDKTSPGTAAQTSQASLPLVMAAQHGSPPPALASLDPRYVCSDLLTAGSDTRIYQLQNSIPYVVGVVAIDLRGNPSPLTEVALQTPVQTRDFYSGYRHDGGSAEGGYCALAPGARGPRGARAAWLILGLALGAAGLRNRRLLRNQPRNRR